ncbi:hypothetical protein [Piscinibacter sp. HJYY11]|uniref:hypothetical protein n=1 Tax=Piscinibacter sp. HJYY11 TaxID=2801333 RepID=UPI00191E13A4|nr:hypothetical protein [Piscinibacter sp. HJYY11]MBL0729440.1 hypothetical protein [Piscinibacter sp. HJYY11]
MSFDFPLGIFGLFKRLLKKPLTALGRFLFREAYLISTVYNSHGQRLGLRPMRLAKGLEFDLHLGKYYLARRQQSPQIWIRATDGNLFSKVVLTVTGTGSKVHHQIAVVLYGVGSTPIQAPIGLPFRDLKFHGDCADEPYESLMIEVRELLDANSRPITNFRSEPRLLDPIDNVEEAMGLRRGDVEVWGEVFNLKFLEWQIDRERQRLMGNPFRMSPLHYWLRSKLFSAEWIVLASFWSKNLVTARQMAEAFHDYLQSIRPVETA